jgi:hypothetical protein
MQFEKSKCQVDFLIYNFHKSKFKIYWPWSSDQLVDFREDCLFCNFISNVAELGFKSVCECEPGTYRKSGIRTPSPTDKQKYSAILTMAILSIRLQWFFFHPQCFKYKTKLYLSYSKLALWTFKCERHRFCCYISKMGSNILQEKKPKYYYWLPRYVLSKNAALGLYIMM